MLVICPACDGKKECEDGSLCDMCGDDGKVLDLTDDKKDYTDTRTVIAKS